MKALKGLVILQCFLTIGCASYTPFIGQLDYNPIYEWDLDQKIYISPFHSTEDPDSLNVRVEASVMSIHPPIPYVYGGSSPPQSYPLSIN